MPILPPNPSLVAILLLIRTEHGTRHVYHYPPHPGQDHPSTASRNDEDDGNHSSDSDTGGAPYSSSGESSYSSVENGYSSTSDDDIRGRVNKMKLNGVSHKKRTNVRESGDIDESGSTSPEKRPSTGWVATKGNKELLGLPSEFPEFLCPPTELDRRRFEMGIDQLTFLGWPCFAKKDGSWRGRRKHRRTSSRDKIDAKSGSTLGNDKKMRVIDETVEETDSALDSGLTTHDDLSEIEPSTGVDNEAESKPGNNRRQDGPKVTQQEEASQNGEPCQTAKSTPSGETLSMFHVVFVMNPPPMEYQIRVDEMYSHVVKHFSKALKREQARSNYVLKECQLLKSMKARHGNCEQHTLEYMLTELRSCLS